MIEKRKYNQEIKKKIIQLHLQKGRTIKSLTQEYNLGSDIARYWISKYRKEWPENTQIIGEKEIGQKNIGLLKKILYNLA